MTVSITVNNPAQTLSLDMVQEQPVQTLSLPIGTGRVSLARQPRSLIDMQLDEGGMVIDFTINAYITKS